MNFRAEGRQLFTFIPVSDTRHGFKSPYNLKNALQGTNMPAQWQNHLDEEQWHTSIHFSFSCALSLILSVCLLFLLSSPLFLEIWRTSIAAWNSCEFYTILTWELQIKVKSASHCLVETGAFSTAAQTHSMKAREAAKLGSHTLLGKWHINFTVISSALPISTPHAMYFKQHCYFNPETSRISDLCCLLSLGETGRALHLAGK